ncbi:monocarboxylate transporter 1-like [Saccostrea echinata]|uniref:monocarboxylate transporter 1-like n=1 Tax=Saccostrea echinata TaxID=191078 RepID=UPI002A83DB93|nr:monocarboxylate transporter 1-like [Saccostrea echinata]
MSAESLGNPVDRGWSWVILGASSAISFLHIGSIKSFGLFFVEILEMFDASVSVTSLISSLQAVCFAVVALPVLSIGINFQSSRFFCLVGGLLCTAAYALSAFAMNVEFIIFTLSILFGCGGGFLFPPTLVILGRYFHKRRGLANGLSMAAACLGGLAYPLYIRFCMDEYGVRGALLLVSGLYMHVLIAACLLTPPEQYGLSKRNEKLPEKENLLLSPIVKRTNSLTLTNDNSALSSSLPNIRLSREPVKTRRRTVTISHDANSPSTHKLKTPNFSQYLSNMSLMSISLVDLSLQKSTTNMKIKEMKWHDYLKKIDLTVLKQIEFILFLVAFCFSAVPAIFFVFLPAFAREKGISDNEILILVCIAGFTDFLGRVVWGFLSDIQRIRTSHIIVITMFILGTLSQMARLLESFVAFCLFITLYGFFAGSPFALFSSMITKIVGIEKFPTAYACLILAQTCTLATSIPFSGFLRDLTSGYYATCHYIGTNALLSALLFLFEPFAQRMDLKRNVNIRTQNVQNSDLQKNGI